MHQADKDVLRALARQVEEIAALPIQQQRASLWRQHNRLQTPRPLVLVEPEGGWDELVPEASLQCADPLARDWERQLRRRIFRHERIGDDAPITDLFRVGWGVSNFRDFGLGAIHRRTADKGAEIWDAPIRSAADVERLRRPEVVIDRDGTARREALAREVFEPHLRVEVGGPLWWTLGLTQDLIYLRGLMQVMMDLYDDPALVHALMAFLRDAYMHALDRLEAEGVLSLNNLPDSHVGSGGRGCTDELPAPDFDGHVRPIDLWALAESQEFSEVGPAQFAEFVLQYQLPLINRFGLACYGCCEPVHNRLDLLIDAIPRLRRVSVSPWCDRQIAADKLGRRIIFSYKPNPALICRAQPGWQEAEQALRETLLIADDCCVEMVLKDTHTFCHDPARPGRWAAMALRVAEEHAR